eukprot:216764_1
MPMHRHLIIPSPILSHITFKRITNHILPVALTAPTHVNITPNPLHANLNKLTTVNKHHLYWIYHRKAKQPLTHRYSHMDNPQQKQINCCLENMGQALTFTVRVR